MPAGKNTKSQNACGPSARVLRNRLEKLIPLIPDYPFRDTDPSGIVEEFILTNHTASQLDIELAALFTAMISWGNRKAIRSTARRLVFEEMGLSPAEYVKKGYYKTGRKHVFGKCVYRTLDFPHFQEVCENVRKGLKGANTLEDVFAGKEIIEILEILCQWLSPAKTGTPGKSVCKRMCMFLRWMVRKEYPDFNIWKNLDPGGLVAIMDVHVNRLTAGIRKCRTPTWKGCMELTEIFRRWDRVDPLKYDIALMMYADDGVGKGESE